MAETLALFGSKPIRTKSYPPHITTGEEEKAAVMRVMDNGILSDFEGSHNEWFLGGPEVKAFEREWADYYDCKHAIAVNSATSGLMAAVGAAAVGPGDEVITTPWTMSATPISVISNNAVPIFCDIDRDTFCMCPDSLEKHITERTKAIMPIHIYGHPANMNAIMEIAKAHNLAVIEDAAQSPGVRYHGTLTGCIGDMGVHSLNNHKIIQTGEGGIVTTNDDDLAERLQLIRNHAEAVIASGKSVKSLVNMVGWNYRMNEIEAAIGREQLKKLKGFLEERLSLIQYLNDGIRHLPGLCLPILKEGCDHSFYRYPLTIDSSIVKISAPRIVEALNAEGMDFYAGYQPLNEYPIYQKMTAFGHQGCPFKCPMYSGKPDYSGNNLTNVSWAREWTFSTEVIHPPLTANDMDEIIQAFEKVWANLDNL
ncbi:MAG: DegT/DnrJ/EryC1/StrS family aminotransferase [Methylocystaceae bacterium]|nr:DegT/DnrJ/EryC1/StrS family aminotransferase [Methylocystaceae bacterium]